MATHSDEASNTSTLKSVADELPLDRLKDEARNGADVLKKWALNAAASRITNLSGRLDDVAGGGPIGQAVRGATEAAGDDNESMAAGAVKGGMRGVFDKAKEKVTGLFSGGSGSDATKATNIVEEIDIGAPLAVVYDQWTQLEDFPGFMKKVEHVEQESDEKVSFKAQVFWSHRTWDATIREQVPDEMILWRSSGEKGHVDGVVTFHELAPRLTRVIVVLEYYPQGLFERTGNIWRAQGRRARLELKHFRRHVMMNVLADPDQVEGWHGEIHDGEVVAGPDEFDEDRRGEEASDEEAEDAEAEEPVDEDEEAEEPVDEDEEAEEPVDEDEEAEDEEAEEPVDEDEEAEEPIDEDEEAEEPVDEDEEAEDEEAEEPEPPRRRRRTR